MPPSPNAPLPALRLESGTLPPAQGLAAWQAAIPQYDVRAAGDPDEAFCVDAKAWLLRNLVVTHTAVSPVVLSRSAERIRADGADTYHLSILLRGSWTGVFEGWERTVGPGQLIGFDLSRPFTITKSEPCESVVLVVSRSVLRDAARTLAVPHGHVFENAAGFLLADHCLALARHMPLASVADASLIVQATLSLLAAALPAGKALNTPHGAVSSATGDATQNTVRQEVCRYIERNIGAADLGPETIGRALRVSRSVLYRSFQATGGVAVYIRKRRLQAVRALLLHPHETRTIADIARSFGFARQDHFASAFRKEFGRTARAVRRHQHVPLTPRDSHGSVGGQLQAWLADLETR